MYNEGLGVWGFKIQGFGYCKLRLFSNGKRESAQPTTAVCGALTSSISAGTGGCDSKP